MDGAVVEVREFRDPRADVATERIMSTRLIGKNVGDDAAPFKRHAGLLRRAADAGVRAARGRDRRLAGRVT